MADEHLIGKWLDGGKIIIDDPTITDGVGHSFADPRGLHVVHAVMLHTGKVLWYCGHVEDGHHALKSYVFDYNRLRGVDPTLPLSPTPPLHSHDFPLHNPALARTTASGQLHQPNAGPHADLFCCHFTHAPDGKVVVVGGSDPDYEVPDSVGPDLSHGSVGEPYIYLFDPNANSDNGQWEIAQTGSAVSRLGQGRWYPTALTLGDGRILVVSGRREHATPETGVSQADKNRSTTANLTEILTPPNYIATTLNGADKSFPLYPGLHLVPDGETDGRIYYTHTTWGLEFDPPANTQSIAVPSLGTSASWTDHAGIAPAQPRREEGMSVLLPPAQDGKILLFGGGAANAAGGGRHLQAPFDTVADEWPPFDSMENASDATSSEILETNGASPAWSAGPTLLHGRTNGHAVILPNKKVLIFGGHNDYKWNAGIANQSLISELYDPVTNTTTLAAEMFFGRMYHSAAVLLPDGSVLVAGGADPSETELDFHSGPPDNFDYPPGWEGPELGVDDALDRKDYEIYRPAYFFRDGPLPDDTRPEIDSTTPETLIGYGDELKIVTTQASAINDVALIRPGAATHHTDTEQRYVNLPITARTSSELTVSMPTNRNLAPPGYYMLWIIDSGKPCKEAKFIRLSETVPNSGGFWDNLCIVVTAATGSREAPDVVFLQRLRGDLLNGSALGKRFIRTVNSLYYSVSPAIAKAMQSHPALKEAIRDILVVPSVTLIRHSKNLAGYKNGNRGLTTFVAMLSMMGAIGLLLSPVLAVIVLSMWLMNALGDKMRRWGQDDE